MTIDSDLGFINVRPSFQKFNCLNKITGRNTHLGCFRVFAQRTTNAPLIENQIQIVRSMTLPVEIGVYPES